MRVVFPPRARLVFGILPVIVIAFVVIDLTTQYARYYPFDFPLRSRVDRLFHMGREANIPGWFSTVLFLAASLQLALIALIKRLTSQKGFAPWVILSLIFVYLSADEAAILHEEIGGILAEQFPDSLFRYGWFAFGALALFVFLLGYLRFYFALPRKTQRLFLAAGLLFVGGALGVELLGSPYENGRPGDFGYALLVALEESLEMGGIIIFIYALYHYMLNYLPRAFLVVDAEGLDGDERS